MTWTLQEAINRTGVLKEGHFLLSSGRHSNRYMQCALLLMHPSDAEETGRALADRFRDLSVDIVVGPALGGVIIAHETARALGVPCLFAERREGVMTLRRGFSVKPGQKVLVVEDVVTTGGSVKEVIALLEETGAEILAVGSIIDRTGGNNPFPVRYEALMSVEIESWTPEECPLCKQGIPAEKPGSRTSKK
ncbi:orotate phosphoribosyltransferase [Staphylospora marina]|uniref:orotate phosphoribosyltransferase n=1 Tax=Staphylospora marina TaxID=2490858 RepID=UPI000F5C02DB|nr:orotate phosphoribosyltransferase [Staphylospora marina]